MPTTTALRFSLDYARARDAVWAGLDLGILEPTLAEMVALSRSFGVRLGIGRSISGGRLWESDWLGARCWSPQRKVAWSLWWPMVSVTVVNLNVVPAMKALAPMLAAQALPLNRIVLATQARVALGDAVAAEDGAEAVVVSIGERTGLSVSDGLGAYRTWAPGPDLPNARRNCISNIRYGGLAPDAAAAQIAGLLADMARVGTSGVGLVDARPLCPRKMLRLSEQIWRGASASPSMVRLLDVR